MKANTTPQQLLKRALWLAFQASQAVEFGFLHKETASSMTEDSLFKSVGSPEDKVYTDYLHGRMMKTSFKIVDGELKISPEIPHPEYQSWRRIYKSATELVNEAKASLS